MKSLKLSLLSESFKKVKYTRCISYIVNFENSYHSKIRTQIELYCRYNIEHTTSNLDELTMDHRLTCLAKLDHSVI